jgi:hypothetical protein
VRNEKARVAAGPSEATTDKILSPAALFAEFHRPFARSRLVVIVAEIRSWGPHADPFLKNAGLDLGLFLKAPEPFTARMLVSSLRIAALAQRRSAEHLDRLAAELEVHALDEEADGLLAEQRRIA